MKSPLTISIFIIVAAFLSSCESHDDSVLKVISTDKGKLSQIYLEKIPTETKELKLSEFISDFNLIPLETKVECLISNTQILFANEFILIGTQNFPGAARLYRFDLNGRFLNEIGRPGQGPGEHLGYMADIIHCYEDNNTILVKWVGTSEKPQLFDFNGNLIEEIVQPYEFTRYIDKLSDSVWFSTGAFAGKVRTPLDSLALVFYSSKGKILKQIPRTEFPPKNLSGYTPNPFGQSLYKFNSKWRFYMGGNDTIFDLVGMKLIPVGVIIPDKNVLPFNKTIAPNDLPGKSDYKILTETTNNWFLEKSTIKTAEIREFRPGEWGGSFSNDRQLIVIDKKNKKGFYVKLIDDIFNMLPSEIFTSGIRWQMDKMFFAPQILQISKFIDNIDEGTLSNSKAKDFIDKLKKMPEDSNPVIFTFTIKDKIKLPD